MIIIASVDFSHNLPLEEAERRDEKSASVIEKFDFDSFSDLELDSPASIYTLLYLLQSKGADDLLFSERSNSALIADSSGEEENVGYYIGHFGISRE